MLAVFGVFFLLFFLQTHSYKKAFLSWRHPQLLSIVEDQRTPKRSPTPNTNQPPTTVLRCREAADNYGQRGDVRATKLEYLINAPAVVDAQPHRPLAAVGGPTVALRWRGTIQTTSTTRRVGIYYI